VPSSISPPLKLKHSMPVQGPQERPPGREPLVPGRAESLRLGAYESGLPLAGTGLLPQGVGLARP